MSGSRKVGFFIEINLRFYWIMKLLFPPKNLMPPTFEEAFGPGTWKLKAKLTFESISNDYNVYTLYQYLFEIYCHITY